MNSSSERSVKYGSGSLKNDRGTVGGKKADMKEERKCVRRVE